jgi:putative transcriptional regulator
MKSENMQEENNFETYLKRLRPGAVLVARSELGDPNFEAAVVIICVYNNDGVYGLVLNHVSHMPVSEIFDGFAGLDNKKVIRIGGPVLQDELQILQLTDKPMDEAYEVIPGVFVGGKWQSIEQIVSTDNAETLLFLGYSGWEQQQLESEIIAGTWEVFNVDLRKLLSDSLHNITGDMNDIRTYIKSIMLQ